MKSIRFTVEQVRALCGGELPHAQGFAWHRVRHFRLEDGVLQPYNGDNLQPGPGIIFSARLTTLVFEANK